MCVVCAVEKCGVWCRVGVPAGDCLQALDGTDMSSYFDFFFETHPGRPTHWGFTDDDAREDFADWCRELGCLPSMVETHEGEDSAAKMLRQVNTALEDIFDRSAPVTSSAADSESAAKIEGMTAEMTAKMAAEDEEYDRREAAALAEKERTMALQRQLMSQKKAAAAVGSDARRLQQMRQTLEELAVKLSAPGLDDAAKARFVAKAEKISAQLMSK
jgi:hypothetical protein